MVKKQMLSLKDERERLDNDRAARWLERAPSNRTTDIVDEPAVGRSMRRMTALDFERLVIQLGLRAHLQPDHHAALRQLAAHDADQAVDHLKRARALLQNPGALKAYLKNILRDVRS